MGHRPEDDAVGRPRGVEHLVGKGRAVLGEAGEPDLVGLERDAEFELLVQDLEHLDRGVGDFGADAIARQYDELHVSSSIDRFGSVLTASAQGRTLRGGRG